MRVLVTGGRDYRASSGSISTAFRRLEVAGGPVECIIHGAASGADTLAAGWAMSRNIKLEPYPADWKNLKVKNVMVKTRRDGSKYNALAGFNRNQRMIDEQYPDVVMEFPGGAGTANMVRRAYDAGYTDTQDMGMFTLHKKPTPIAAHCITTVESARSIVRTLKKADPELRSIFLPVEKISALVSDALKKAQYNDGSYTVVRDNWHHARAFMTEGVRLCGWRERA